jgi:NAD(P)H-hydrate epimerase
MIRITFDNIFTLLPSRSRFAHKGDFGHALLVAGSKGKTGASVLAAKACLRSGAGLLTVHVPACAEIAMQTALPEAMTEVDKETGFITEIGNLLKYKAIGIGPGMGLRRETAGVLSRLFEHKDKQLVIDADALNLISQEKYLLDVVPPESILTPHSGEFDRLAGTSANAEERAEKAMAMASDLKVYIVLKGADTVIYTPTGECFINTTGNPGMATAGSGDVLTGIILGLSAQGHSPLNAARIGVFLHGLAGDIAVSKTSQESMIAGDIIENLGFAYKMIREHI